MRPATPASAAGTAASTGAIASATEPGPSVTDAASGTAATGISLALAGAPARIHDNGEERHPDPQHTAGDEHEAQVAIHRDVGAAEGGRPRPAA